MLSELFKEFCATNIRANTSPLSAEFKANLVASLTASPFSTVIQAWSVLDFQNYVHLATSGFDTYFGYKPGEITAEKILEIVHPEDQPAFAKLYSLCLMGLLNMPFPTTGIGHFCINYRMLKANGEYLAISETNNILACDPHNHFPLINLAQITLLPRGREFGRVSYHFQIKDEQGSVEIMRGFLSQYDNNVNVFTESELKIVRLMKLGLTSQQIADRIFLSKHTVDKYRKNMLEKTGCKNSPQLITYMDGLNIL